MPTLNTARFRFFGDLNDFLPVSQQQRTLDYSFRGAPAVKDSIEAIGVPHPEVYFLQANGTPVDLSYRLTDGDHVSVYPLLREALPTNGLLRSPPPAVPDFVLDTHLGQLARYLRMLGFDTCYQNDRADSKLARIAEEENRVLLTRDLGLLKRSRVVYGAFVRATDPEWQVKEVLARYALHDAARPMTRCLKCNGILHPVDKADVLDDLPPRTRTHFDEFFQCARCEQVYWKGSHYERMQRFIERVTKDDGQ